MSYRKQFIVKPGEKVNLHKIDPSFKDKHESFNVYKHYDGYPTEALESIKAAKEFAWDLPRFETMSKL